MQSKQISLFRIGPVVRISRFHRDGQVDMSGSMNRNPSSQPPNNNKDGRKDVLNLTVVLSKRNVRKQHKQQQQQTSKQHTMTTRLSSTGPQVVIEQRSYNKSAYQQAASSVSSRKPHGGP
ncbi:unnamed protein product [Rhizophagus irregularis]|nr:unnamed protein product [Rhizophagus irregularis]